MSSAGDHHLSTASRRYTPKHATFRKASTERGPDAATPSGNCQISLNMCMAMLRGTGEDHQSGYHFRLRPPSSPRPGPGPGQAGCLPLLCHTTFTRHVWVHHATTPDEDHPEGVTGHANSWQGAPQTPHERGRHQPPNARSPPINLTTCATGRDKPC